MKLRKFALLGVFIINQFLFAQVSPVIDRTTFDLSNFQSTLDQIRAQPRRTAIIKSSIWINQVYQYLMGLKRGMSFAEIEARTSYETNIFQIEEVSKFWDQIGNYSLIAGSALGVVTLVLPENEQFGYTNDVKSLISGLCFGIGGILKSVGSFMYNEDTKQMEASIRESIGRIAVSRQAVEDIKTRMELYKKINFRISTIVSSLAPFNEICDPTKNNSDEEVYEFIEANLSELQSIANELEILGTQIGLLYAELETRITYYEELYRTTYKIPNDKNPFIKLSDTIRNEKNDWVNSNEIKWFYVLRDLRLSYL